MQENFHDNEIIMYNTRDIQNIFKCGKRQAYELIHTSGFPTIRIGKKLLVEKQALLKWLDKNRGKEIITN